MFKKLLFATTASPVCDNAAKVAFDLEMKWEAKLFILHVLGFPAAASTCSSPTCAPASARSTSQDYVEWVKEELNNTYGKLLEDSNASIVTAIGDPYREILRLARKENVDMIIMGAHSREEEVGATKHRSIAGSTMRKVAKAARCAVVIVNRPCTTCWRLFSNIVVGIDFSKASESAFLWAFKLAREVGAKLHIFHAIDITAEGLTLPAGQTTIEQRIKEARRRIEQHMVPKLKGYDKYSIEVWEGIPYVEILKFARDRQGDLIVMAHHTREVDPEEAELGSTVEQVVLRVLLPGGERQPPGQGGRPDRDGTGR
ncbi:MAG: universal stress protein [Desulfobacterales bacterium]|nr:universal stress protein [Desulfobacterales bacterium]